MWHAVLDHSIVDHGAGDMMIADMKLHSHVCVKNRYTETVPEVRDNNVFSSTSSTSFLQFHPSNSAKSSSSGASISTLHHNRKRPVYYEDSIVAGKSSSRNSSFLSTNPRTSEDLTASHLPYSALIHKVYVNLEDALQTVSKVVHSGNESSNGDTTVHPPIPASLISLKSTYESMKTLEKFAMPLQWLGSLYPTRVLKFLLADLQVHFVRLKTELAALQLEHEYGGLKSVGGRLRESIEILRRIDTVDPVLDLNVQSWHLGKVGVGKGLNLL